MPLFPPGGAKKGSQRKHIKRQEDSDGFDSRNSETVSQSGSEISSDGAELESALPPGEPAASLDWVDSNGNCLSDQQMSEGTETHMSEGAARSQDDAPTLQTIEGPDIRLDAPPDRILKDFYMDIDKLVKEATDDLQLQFDLGDSTDVAFADTSEEMQSGSDAAAATSAATSGTTTAMTASIQGGLQGGGNIATGEHFVSAQLHKSDPSLV